MCANGDCYLAQGCESISTPTVGSRKDEGASRKDRRVFTSYEQQREKMMLERKYLGIKLNFHNGDMFLNEKPMSLKELNMLVRSLLDMAKWHRQFEKQSQDALRAAPSHGGDEELHL